MAPSRPCISGRPGRIAIFQNDSSHAFGRERPVDEIIIADRSAAGRHQNIGVEIARAPHRLDRLIELVGHDAEIDEVGAFGADQRRKRKAVRIDDLAGSGLGAGRHQFVAGREQRDLGLAINRHQRMVHAGDQREVARGQPMAFGEQLVAQAEIEPLRADVAAFGGGLLHLDPIAVALGQFLHHDGVGAGRHEAAGEDAGGFAGADLG